MELWLAITLIIVALIVGLIVGFLIARRAMMKYFEQNPPITEDMVRTMMSQMGRTPSQKQVNQVMRSITQSTPKKNTAKK